MQNYVEYNILMEYMEGGSLSDIMRKNETGLKIGTIKNIMRQLLRGITHLHEHNIIHRDLKPANILTCTKQAIFKIADFGISTEVIEQMSTCKRSVAGTPWYMAPEVILGQPYSFGVDIWSLGCVLYGKVIPDAGGECLEIVVPAPDPSEHVVAEPFG